MTHNVLLISRYQKNNIETITPTCSPNSFVRIESLLQYCESKINLTGENCFHAVIYAYIEYFHFGNTTNFLLFNEEKRRFYALVNR